jgi:hypothetical protein
MFYHQLNEFHTPKNNNGYFNNKYRAPHCGMTLSVMGSMVSMK